MTPPNHEEISAEVKMPDSVREAEMMAKLGIAYLRQHAPERLTPEHDIVRRQALEEAAALATEYAQWHDKNDDGLSGFAAMSVGAEEVADRIRALIHQTEKEG